jgi:hypothetical protein
LALLLRSEVAAIGSSLSLTGFWNDVGLASFLWGTSLKRGDSEKPKADLLAENIIACFGKTLSSLWTLKQCELN